MMPMVDPTLRAWWRGERPVILKTTVTVFVICMLATWLGATIGAVFAHDTGEGAWINNQRLTDPETKQWCCNLHDCRDETTNVRGVEGGYLIVSTGEVIPRERVIWKSPGGWWRCRNLSDGSTRCLIGPPNGS